MDLTTKQRSVLRGKGSILKPLVFVGKEGLTQGTIAEISQCLFAHELVKISILNNAEVTAKEVMQQLVDTLGCQAVQVIGSKVVVYSYSDKDGIRHIEF